VESSVPQLEDQEPLRSDALRVGLMAWLLAAAPVAVPSAANFPQADVRSKTVMKSPVLTFSIKPSDFYLLQEEGEL